MRVAFYGNNLNIGYYFASGMRALGIDAALLYVEEPHPQDRPEWWIKGKIDRSFVIDFGKPFALSSFLPLRADPRVRELYQTASNFDVIVFMQDGPALFSELDHPRKIFLSQGGDLQNFPFALHQYANISMIRALVTRRWGQRQSRPEGQSATAAGSVSSIGRSLKKHAMRQLRQRRGLRQCVHWICQPNQVPLVEKLGWSLDKVSFLPFPYFVPLEPTEVADSRQLTFNEMLFMHPTRQLFRALDKNLYLKGNDKLIRAFAAFKAETGLPGRLRMVRKGRDVDAADELVSELGLRSHVDWVNEMSNLDLRRYYSIPNAVICDQFDPSLGYLGAIGREASMYGRPLITAFEDHNRRLFGDDMPPHVFPATTEVGIMQAMIKLAAMEPKEIAELQLKARQWSHRHFSPSCLLPRFKEVFVKAMKANTSQRVAS